MVVIVVAIAASVTSVFLPVEILETVFTFVLTVVDSAMILYLLGSI